MPALGALLRHVVGPGAVLYECRNCGTTLNEEKPQCTECESSEIATYRFP
jgi:predicted Zn-ribbon and HTH transcriptional regulator